MPKYNTRQRTVLLNYLRCHADEVLSAKQISEALIDENISISAVYRNLSDLENEGKVHRITKSDSRNLCFRYTDAEECKSHLHLSCSGCGKTFHMDVPSTKTLIENVEKGSDFTIDSSDTVLYGLCKNCKRKDI